MINARPAAVLFDMDGLLLDAERLIRDAMIAVMADFGFTMSRADYAELIGRPEPASRAIMQGRFGALLDYDVMRAQVRQRIRSEWGPIRPLKPGAADLLAQVNAAGIPGCRRHLVRTGAGPRASGPCRAAGWVCHHRWLRRRCQRQAKSRTLSHRRRPPWHIARRRAGLGRQPQWHHRCAHGRGAGNHGARSAARHARNHAAPAGRGR